MPSAINGTGTKHFGKSNYVEDKENELEELDTTLWFALFWLPIIPLKSYRIKQQVWYVRNDENLPKVDTQSGGYSWDHTFTVVKNQSLNWLQIIKTYLIVYGSIVLILALIAFVNSHQ